MHRLKGLNVQPLPDDLLDDIALPDSSRYMALGLIANPFVVPDHPDEDPAIESEVSAAGNLLLNAVVERVAEEAPRPLTVLKADIPSQYAMRAMGAAEPYLAADESLSILYAYVPLFHMRIGASRATLAVLAERLAFRDFRHTLVAYLQSVIASPDTELASFSALPAGALDSLADRLASQPDDAVIGVFGVGGVESHPELSQVADLRQTDFTEEDAGPEADAELDATVGEAPGTALVEAEAVKDREAVDCALFDYFIEYTATHLSPVIARALRLYRSRGEAAFASELRITKAPRKTLGALLRLARFRFKGIAFLYDGFENWTEVPEEMRAKLMGSLSEMRWKNAGLAFPVFLLTEGEAPEVEETFGGSGSIRWDFPGLVPMQEAPGELLEDVVSFWLEAAALSGSTPLSLEDDVLSRLVEAAEGSMARFVRMGRAAIESAAERGIAGLDEAAFEAGVEAGKA